MRGTPNTTDHRFALGDRVEYGTGGPHGGDRLGEVVREHREYRQDGYLIRPLSGGPGDGHLPSVYPGRMVMPATMARWTYSPARNRYERNYSEIRPTKTEQEGPEGFYVTVRRNTATGVLLGPYPTKEEAESHVRDGKRLAHDVDPFTAFDAFGVTRVKVSSGAKLPTGKLNHLMTEEEPVTGFPRDADVCDPAYGDVRSG